MSDADFGADGGKRNWRRGGRAPPPVYGDGGSDIDRFFDALADTRRRHVLIYLQNHQKAFLQTIARHVAKQEGIETRDEEFGRLQVELLHLHLPKLADHGLISFDGRTNTARLEPLPDAVEEILELAADLEETDAADP